MLIRCRICDERMSHAEWMNKNDCCEPNCRCPGVQKLAMKTQEVIEQAKSGSNKVNTQITRGPVPHGYRAEVSQMILTVPDVKVIDVYPLRKR